MVRQDEPFECVYERVRSRVADTPLETSAGLISVTVSIETVTGSGASTVDEMLLQYGISVNFGF